MKRLGAMALSVAAGFGLIALVLAAEPGPPGPEGDPSRAIEEMAEAASNFLAALSPDQKRRVTYLFKDQERRNLHFFPIPRRGVPMKELNDAQRALGHALLSTGLSARGYFKATTIMSLGQVLRDLEPQSPNPFRDSDQYYFTIFGKPDPQGTWGWRLEGFHLSFNFTIVGGRAVASAPSFMGAHPAVVKDGPRQGLFVLRNEEEGGRELIRSMDEGQRKAAIFPLTKFEETVGGILTGNVPRLEPRAPRGVPASRMTPAQREILLRLVREYVQRHRGELAEQDWAKLQAAGTEKIHFSWDGGLEPGEPHHYMIQGPTFLVELDNTQDGANHVHCIWRDFEGDFGDDLLRRHYAEHHGK
jgi:hypothetical protein